MDFYNIVEETFPSSGETVNPFSQKIDNQWVEGTVSIDFLNKHFGQYSTAQEMINATESEGLKKFFAWLRDEKGLLN